MTVEIRRGTARFVDREVGRITHHSFAFGDHHDPKRLRFGPMVCHDDHLVGGGRGFDTHRHSGLEIVTYVVAGELVHGHGDGSDPTTLPAGSLAVLSTGPGVEHAEHASAAGPCRWVQVWLAAAEDATEASYAVTPADALAAGPVEVATGGGPATLTVVRLEAGASTSLPIAPRVHAFVATGALVRSSLAEPLSAGDAFLLTDEERVLELTAGVPTVLLVWALPER